jgi:arsenite oxidase small subunit
MNQPRACRGSEKTLGEQAKGPRKDEKVDEDRRNFLKASVVASAVIAVAGAAAVAKSVGSIGEESTAVGFPTVKVANISGLTVNTPVTFNYPLDNEANILVKLGVKAEDGIGPDSDIIAFSDICQHLGCNPLYIPQGSSPPCAPSYVAKGPEMYCCCHGSIYDLLNDAEVIGGPAPRPVPRVILTMDSSGDIYATGMTPPTIFDHGTPGSTDVSADLEGGTVVS